MTVIRNLRKFGNIQLSKKANIRTIFTNYIRGKSYSVNEVNANDFPEPLTGYTPQLYGTPKSSPYWSDRSPANAYQDDLLLNQSVSNFTTHSPGDGNNNYTGFVFNEPTVSTVFILKPSKLSGTSNILWPHNFYVIASNNGVDFETISPEFTPLGNSAISTLALYDFNPDKKAFTEYRLRMIGNSFSPTYQYIDALYWY